MSDIQSQSGFFQVIRNKLHDAIRGIGWEVHRLESAEELRKRRWRQAEIDKWLFAQRYLPHVVLDIGANTGQFAELIRQVLPEARIISFEPLSDCFSELNRNPRIAPPFEAHPYALGNDSGNINMYRNSFSPSSSLLPMAKLHSREYPHTGESELVPVELKRLDELRDSLNITTPFIAKLDVQGFEDQVILGGRKTLAEAAAIVMEVSAYPLYEGAPTFDDLNRLMKEMGFAFRGSVDQLRSQKDSRVLQFDALFEKVS
jgi:FkbM family methyltransferase